MKNPLGKTQIKPDGGVLPSPPLYVQGLILQLSDNSQL